MNTTESGHFMGGQGRKANVKQIGVSDHNSCCEDYIQNQVRKESKNGLQGHLGDGIGFLEDFT